MASTLTYFMTPEDELAFLRELEKWKFEVYPEVVDPRYKPFFATAENQGLLVDESYYLAMPEAGDAKARTIKRGKNAGMLEIEEVGSPVFHFERSLELDGELRSGRIWGELEVVGDRKMKMRKPDLLRVAFEGMRDYFKRRYHRSNPPGIFVGPQAARRANQGLVLREAGRKGELYKVHR